MDVFNGTFVIVPIFNTDNNDTSIRTKIYYVYVYIQEIKDSDDRV